MLLLITADSKGFLQLTNSMLCAKAYVALANQRVTHYICPARSRARVRAVAAATPAQAERAFVASAAQQLADVAEARHLSQKRVCLYRSAARTLCGDANV